MSDMEMFLTLATHNLPLPLQRGAEDTDTA